MWLTCDCVRAVCSSIYAMYAAMFCMHLSYAWQQPAVSSQLLDDSSYTSLLQFLLFRHTVCGVLLV